MTRTHNVLLLGFIALFCSCEADVRSEPPHGQEPGGQLWVYIVQLHRTCWGIAFGSPRVRKAESGERFLLRSPRSALRSPTERENAMFDENPIALVKLQ